jgi:hypothetical protein
MGLRLQHVLGPALLAVLAIALVRPGPAVEAGARDLAPVRAALAARPPAIVLALRRLAYTNPEDDSFGGLRRWSRAPRVRLGAGAPDDVRRALDATLAELATWLGRRAPAVAQREDEPDIAIEMGDGVGQGSGWTSWGADGALDHARIMIPAGGDADDRARAVRFQLLRALGLGMGADGAPRDSVLADGERFGASDRQMIELLYDERLPIGLSRDELDRASAAETR